MRVVLSRSSQRPKCLVGICKLFLFANNKSQPDEDNDGDRNNIKYHYLLHTRVFLIMSSAVVILFSAECRINFAFGKKWSFTATLL